MPRRDQDLDVTPTLPVADMAKSVEFWEAAGFDVNRYDDGFAFVSFDEQSVFDLDLVEGSTRRRTAPAATSSPTRPRPGTPASQPPE